MTLRLEEEGADTEHISEEPPMNHFPCAATTQSGYYHCKEVTKSMGHEMSKNYVRCNLYRGLLLTIFKSRIPRTRELAGIRLQCI